MGGGDGATYSVEEINKAKQKLENLGKDANNIIKLAADANPDWKVWGLVGAIPAVLYWNLAAKELYEHLDLMGKSLEDKVMRLDATGKAYHATTQAQLDALKKIEDLLGKTGA